MDTRDPRPSSQGLVSQEDGCLWMKMDSNTVTNQTKSPSETWGEMPQVEPIASPHAPAVINRYFSVMNDEGIDDVLIPPPPPPYMAPLLPAGCSTDTTESNSSVTLTAGAGDATEAEHNPGGLDWHCGDRQLMAAHNEVDEVKASTVQTSKGIMDTDSLSKDEDSALLKDQDLTSMEGTGSLKETCRDPSGRHHQDSTTEDKKSSEEPQSIILTGGEEYRRGSKEGQDKYQEQEQVPSSIEENSDAATQSKIKDACDLAETDSKWKTKNTGGNSEETHASRLSGLSVNYDNLESSGLPEPCKCRYSNMETEANQPQVVETPKKLCNDDEEHVDTRSLNFTLTKCDWVRRESGSSEMQMPRLPTSEGSEETETKEEVDGSRTIATDIQQGEQLLQRLQLVQQRQDVLTPQSCHTSKQVVEETIGETKGELGREVCDTEARTDEQTGGDKEEESCFHAVEDEDEENGGKDPETKPLGFLLTTPAEPEPHITARTETGDADDDQSDSWVPADLSPIDPHETSSAPIPFASIRHRFSATETSIERQIHEAAQAKQHLQRAGGTFDLTDNPDVLEIPFKTNISLEQLPTNADHWHFSEQKMQKEISQEIQRELVMVNQGKIPGGYSKGEVRQLKETKLLFEAFQQDNTEGPTRHRKSPTSFTKGPVYPSVLERTRSLEMFSLKSSPVTRARSLRLYNSATTEKHKGPEDLRSKSPTGGPREKTRLFPYLKQDKHLRLHRSMDSISSGASAFETRGKTKQRNTAQDSPILKQNPFFKLRPALALQPEVEKDIREAKEREEELRRQRYTLYGENTQNNKDIENSQLTSALEPDIRQSRGKLDRVWPPPSKREQMKSEQTQQEAKVQRAGGQKAPLWQRWEAGLINGQPSRENK